MMHSYEADGRAKVYVALAGASILLVWLLNLGLNAIDFDPQWWVGAPSFAACYSVLYWVFDRFVWRLGLLRTLRLMHVPDLNGDWEGEVVSSYDQADGAHSVSVQIIQQWSKIAIGLETEQSRSQSTMAHLNAVDLLNPELTYQYVNEPNVVALPTMEMHKGTATLKLSGSRLEGDYYTGRGRGEVGALKLRRCRK